MRKTFLTGACALALAACGGDDTEAEIAETQKEIAAAEAEADAEAPVPSEDDPAALSPAAEAFLEENAGREGVRVTDSGLQIETLEEGEGRTPTTADILRINYKVTTQEGEVLEDSERSGAPVVVPGYEQMALPGLLEAIPQMREGERAKITMPPSLAFGGRVPPGAGVGPGDLIVFDLDLVEVIAPDDEERLTALRAEEDARLEERRAAMQAEFEARVAENAASSEAFLSEKRAEAGVKATESGLLYEVVSNAGDGPSPEASDRVRVHYRGTLPNGETFDSSYDRGEPATFPLGRLVKAWQVAIPNMAVGDKIELVAPASMAYGPVGRGPIPGGATLLFTVELIDIAE